jgi:phosphoribosylformylglycinamidine synthase PurS subunit
MQFNVKIYVSLKPAVNDPQGVTIQNALNSLGFQGFSTVRAGKYFTLRVEATDAVKAEKQVDEACQKLLANPVIEQYQYELKSA